MKNITLSEINYKNTRFLHKFLSPAGSILPRTKSGLSAKQQRRLTKAIKRARHLALLPFTSTI